MVELEPRPKDSRGDNSTATWLSRSHAEEGLTCFFELRHMESLRLDLLVLAKLIIKVSRCTDSMQGEEAQASHGSMEDQSGPCLQIVFVSRQ